MAAFDVEAYIGQYTGGTKISRLLHIWEVATQSGHPASSAGASATSSIVVAAAAGVSHLERSGSVGGSGAAAGFGAAPPGTYPPTLAKDTAHLILTELKKTRNTSLYKDICKRLESKGFPVKMDESWIVQTDDSAGATVTRLEQELSASKANTIKESIRLGFNSLGGFYYDRGDLCNSLKAYVRSREYCTTAKQILDMCLIVIRISLELNNMGLVSQYLVKAEQTAESLKDKGDQAKLKVVSGLTSVIGEKYRQAARKFLETPADTAASYAELMSAADVAIFGGLCALATFDRMELKTKVIDNTAFKGFLELVPELREIIRDFYDSRYTTCLSGLERMKDTLMLDIYLHRHVSALYAQIRQRALRQYVSPFLSVDLRKMATAFNTPVPALEKELAALIMDGGIRARIDSHNKVLFARRDNERATTYTKAISTGRDFVSETESSIRQLSMLRNDFQVRQPRGATGPGGSSGSSGGLPISGAHQIQMMGLGNFANLGNFASLASFNQQQHSGL